MPNYAEQRNAVVKSLETVLDDLKFGTYGTAKEKIQRAITAINGFATHGGGMQARAAVNALNDAVSDFANWRTTSGQHQGKVQKAIDYLLEIDFAKGIPMKFGGRGY